MVIRGPFFQDIGFAQLYPENDRDIDEARWGAGCRHSRGGSTGRHNIEIADNFIKKLAVIEKDLPEDVTWVRPRFH